LIDWQGNVSGIAGDEWDPNYSIRQGHVSGIAGVEWDPNSLIGRAT